MPKNARLEANANVPTISLPVVAGGFVPSAVRQCPERRFEIDADLADQDLAGWLRARY